MDISVEDIYNQIFNAAVEAFKDGWHAIKTYAPTEFRKMAVQLAEISENVALYKLDRTKGYSKKTGKLLFKMQRTASESVLVAITQLTLITVQKALNAIIRILKKAFEGFFATII